MSRPRRDRDRTAPDVRAVLTDRFRRRVDRWTGSALEGSDTAGRRILDALEAREDVTVHGMYLPADLRPGGIQGRYLVDGDGLVQRTE